jgi:hypothetical protein
MTTLQGQPTRAAAKWARAMANSVEANQRRRRREPPIIDWDEAIARLHDILDDILELSLAAGGSSGQAKSKCAQGPSRR